MAKGFVRISKDAEGGANVTNIGKVKKTRYDNDRFAKFKMRVNINFCDLIKGNEK